MPPHPTASATVEQSSFLYGIAPRYHRAKRERTLSRFWKDTFDEWFLRWPVVPGLIEHGLLPPEASNYRFTPEQKMVVNEAMDPILDIIMDTMNELYEKWIDVKLAEEVRKKWINFMQRGTAEGTPEGREERS